MWNVRVRECGNVRVWKCESVEMHGRRKCIFTSPHSSIFTFPHSFISTFFTVFHPVPKYDLLMEMLLERDKLLYRLPAIQ